MKPKNGDMYMKRDNQILIFHGKRATHDSGSDRYITAVFGGTYSGNFGVGGDSDKAKEIEECPELYTYLGNISDIFRGVLDGKTKAR